MICCTIGPQNELGPVVAPYGSGNTSRGNGANRSPIAIDIQIDFNLLNHENFPASIIVNTSHPTISRSSCESSFLFRKFSMLHAMSLADPEH